MKKLMVPGCYPGEPGFSNPNDHRDKSQEVHLGYEPHEPKGYNSGNSRNGYSKKSLKTSSGKVEIEVPRDRDGSFEPKFVEKHKSFES